MRENSPTYIRELIVPASRNAIRAQLRSARTDVQALAYARVRHTYGEWGGFSFGPSAVAVIGDLQVGAQD